MKLEHFLSSKKKVTVRVPNAISQKSGAMIPIFFFFAKIDFKKTDRNREVVKVSKNKAVMVRGRL